MCAPVGVLGGRWGAFFESAEGTCGRLGDRSPTLGTLGEVGMEREDSISIGRWAAQRAAKADGGPDGADVRAGGCSGSLGPRAVRGEEKGQLKWSGIRFWPMI